jgi:glutamate-1-semialdehyde 2,1-aminomutase/spore coat polysaccharide biosynthesis protein SpsF
MKKIAIIQARMGSTRFPGKVLADLNGKTLLQHVVERAQKIPTIDDVIVATSTLELDNAIQDWCLNYKVNCFRGDEADVLKRFYETAEANKADIVVRITADCPLLDPNLAGQILHLVAHCGADYASNILPPTWPDGLDCEAFTFDALKDAYNNAHRSSDREHVTPYILNNQHQFKVRNIASASPELRAHRWVVDLPEDLEYVAKILLHSTENPSTWDILDTLHQHREIVRLISKRNEGFSKSLKEEEVYCVSFTKTHELIKRSLNTIPLGSQTFSKSYIQYPENTSPMFLTHGMGGRVWDVDGNEYIDLVSGLLPIVLGYNDQDVNQAIQNQLYKGISFSLSTELEVQLAETLCNLIPSAEKVRFAKNGTDVTSAAIRLARAYTGRDKVIACGYHGWQDWYIGTTTRNKGVPKVVSDLTTIIPYNDLNRAEELLKTEAYACLILEPCNITAPHEGYLEELKQLCELYGSMLVFDEVVTGFRFHIGGAQTYFGVTPHLSCFGKAMGNGMPISAIVGRNDIMKEMEEIFFSGTFGGEALSLAASIATIEKLQKEKVIDYLWTYGGSLAKEVEFSLLKNDLGSAIKLGGYDVWKLFQFLHHPNATAFEIKTLFIQEMIKRGILINSAINISYAHKELEKYKFTQALNETFELIAKCLKENCIKKNLRSPAIKPLFKVR